MPNQTLGELFTLAINKVLEQNNFEDIFKYGEKREELPVEFYQGNFSYGNNLVTYNSSLIYSCYSSYIDLTNVSANEKVVISIPSNLYVLAFGFDTNTDSYTKITSVSTWKKGGEIEFYVDNVNKNYVLLQVEQEAMSSGTLTPEECEGVKVYVASESAAMKKAKEAYALATTAGSSE